MANTFTHETSWIYEKNSQMLCDAGNWKKATRVTWVYFCKPTKKYLILFDWEHLVRPLRFPKRRLKVRIVYLYTAKWIDKTSHQINIPNSLFCECLGYLPLWPILSHHESNRICEGNWQMVFDRESFKILPQSHRRFFLLDIRKMFHFV